MLVWFGLDECGIVKVTVRIISLRAQNYRPGENLPGEWDEWRPVLKKFNG
jgi:hypothetical protein